MSKLSIRKLEKFSPERMEKINVFESPRLMLGLNCLEAGQSQRHHSHPEADKFYYVVAGRAVFSLGDETLEATSGEMVLCPAGSPHGIERALERTTILVGLAPWNQNR